MAWANGRRTPRTTRGTLAIPPGRMASSSLIEGRLLFVRVEWAVKNKKNIYIPRIFTKILGCRKKKKKKKKEIKSRDDR